MDARRRVDGGERMSVSVRWKWLGVEAKEEINMVGMEGAGRGEREGVGWLNEEEDSREERRASERASFPTGRSRF